MSDAFVPISFVADELLTSTKMNQLAADLSYFHDGTGLGDGIILTRHLGASGSLEIPFTNISGSGVNAEDTIIYSTSEKAIGVWVDGKTLYRKCFVRTGSGTAGAAFNHGITFDTVIRLTMMLKDNGATQWRQLPWLYSATDSNWIGGVYITPTQVATQYQVGSPTIATADKSIIIVEYTKP